MSHTIFEQTGNRRPGASVLWHGLMSVIDQEGSLSISDPSNQGKSTGRRPKQVVERLPFGPPPLIGGEDPAAYDELLAHISGLVKPSDILEEIWVRDVVDLVWEAFRLRRLKASLMAASAHEGVKKILEPLYGWSDVDSLANSWAARDRVAVKKVDKLLASAGLGMDAVMAQTLCINIDNVEHIDRMIMTAEARRNAILREVDRHRATLGQKLRQAATQVEDAGFKVIESSPVPKGSAA